MPATRPPSVSKVYAAFDAAALGVFRAAMARSRGGVVRLSDLLAAVAAAEPGLARERLSEHGCRLAQQPPAPGPAPAPLLNEPAVRAVLFRAMARAVTLERARITPGVILDALIDVCPHLAQREESESPRRAIAHPKPSAKGFLSRADSDATGVVGEVLMQWLAYQAAPTGLERDHALKRLQDLLQGM